MLTMNQSSSIVHINHCPHTAHVSGLAWGINSIPRLSIVLSSNLSLQGCHSNLIIWANVPRNKTWTNCTKTGLLWIMIGQKITDWRLKQCIHDCKVSFEWKSFQNRAVRKNLENSKHSGELFLFTAPHRCFLLGTNG